MTQVCTFPFSSWEAITLDHRHTAGFPVFNIKKRDCCLIVQDGKDAKGARGYTFYGLSFSPPPHVAMVEKKKKEEGFLEVKTLLLNMP